MTGGAGSVVVEGRHVIFPEGRVKRRAVTGFAALHVFPLDRTFMVTLLTGNFLLKGMVRMLKNHRPASVVQQDALGHGLVRLGQHIAHHGHHRQNGCQQRYGNITLLQRCTPSVRTVARRGAAYRSARSGLAAVRPLRPENRDNFPPLTRSGVDPLQPLSHCGLRLKATQLEVGYNFKANPLLSIATQQ